jgi:hypothetical protein
VLLVSMLVSIEPAVCACAAGPVMRMQAAPGLSAVADRPMYDACCLAELFQHRGGMPYLECAFV